MERRFCWQQPREPGDRCGKDSELFVSLVTQQQRLLKQNTESIKSKERKIWFHLRLDYSTDGKKMMSWTLMAWLPDAGHLRTSLMAGEDWESLHSSLTTFFEVWNKTLAFVSMFLPYLFLNFPFLCPMACHLVHAHSIFSPAWEWQVFCCFHVVWSALFIVCIKNLRMHWGYLITHLPTLEENQTLKVLSFTNLTSFQILCLSKFLSERRILSMRFIMIFVTLPALYLCKSSATCLPVALSDDAPVGEILDMDIVSWEKNEQSLSVQKIFVLALHYNMRQNVQN